MTTIKLGNKEITIVGSPMTPYFYKKAFNQSFSGDFIDMQQMDTDLSKFDDINFLQMIWAMEYTRKMGKDMIDFESWLGEFEYMDLMEVVDVVIDEAMNACFRDNKPKSGEDNIDAPSK